MKVLELKNLIPVLTTKENVEFIMELQGKKRAERSERAMELLSAVGIADRAYFFLNFGKDSFNIIPISFLQYNPHPNH